MKIQIHRWFSLECFRVKGALKPKLSGRVINKSCFVVSLSIHLMFILIYTSFYYMWSPLLGMQLQIGSMVCSTQQAYTQFSNKHIKNEVICSLLQRTKLCLHKFCNSVVLCQSWTKREFSSNKYKLNICDHSCLYLHKAELGALMLRTCI